MTASNEHLRRELRIDETLSHALTKVRLNFGLTEATMAELDEQQRVLDEKILRLSDQINAGKRKRGRR